jgi:hypothetical protein
MYFRPVRLKAELHAVPQPLFFPGGAAFHIRRQVFIQPGFAIDFNGRYGTFFPFIAAGGLLARIAALTCRLLPVIFGMLLILCLPILYSALGGRALLAAALQ